MSSNPLPGPPISAILSLKENQTVLPPAPPVECRRPSLSDSIKSIAPFNHPPLTPDEPEHEKNDDTPLTKTESISQLEKSPPSNSTGNSDKVPNPLRGPIHLQGVALGITGALGLGIGSGAKFLKSTKRATNFVLKSGSKLIGDHSDWNITPKDRMRNIDELRRHVPTPEECELLNVPNDRLLIDNMKDVLYLSGGCAGVRFTSNELKSLQGVVSNIQDLIKTLEKTYSKLTPEQVKLNVNPTASATISRTTGNSNAANDNVKVIYFHGVADDLTNLIARLQEVVHAKQKTIDKNSAVKMDSDPDNLTGALPRPKWLDLLINKCDEFLNNANASTNSASSNSPIKKAVTKGKLAAFISFCLVKKVPCTDDEIEALEDVVQASNDMKVLFTYGESLQAAVSKQPREYWALRVFEFLKKISEIKSIASDEASLQTFTV